MAKGVSRVQLSSVLLLLSLAATNVGYHWCVVRVLATQNKLGIVVVVAFHPGHCCCFYPARPDSCGPLGVWWIFPHCIRRSNCPRTIFIIDIVFCEFLPLYSIEGGERVSHFFRGGHHPHIVQR